MRRAGRVVAEMHAATRAAARPGRHHRRPGSGRPGGPRPARATSNFLNYHGFPAVICTSPNSMIVHGIPGPYRLQDGDILSIDCGAIIEGYHGDAAFTMGIGEIDHRGREAHPGHRGEPRGPGSQQMVLAIGSTTSAWPSRPWPRRPASPWCGSTWATPSGRPCTRSPRCPTTGRAARAGAEARHGLRGRAHGQHRRARDPACSTTAGAWSPPTAACRPTSSTPSRSPTTAPRCSPSPTDGPGGGRSMDAYP